MKPIKITYENIPTLDAALAKVNGNATAHTATGTDVYLLECWADNKLLDLLGNKKDMPCAMAGFAVGLLCRTPTSSAARSPASQSIVSPKIGGW